MKKTLDIQWTELLVELESICKKHIHDYLAIRRFIPSKFYRISYRNYEIVECEIVDWFIIESRAYPRFKKKVTKNNIEDLKNYISKLDINITEDKIFMKYRESESSSTLTIKEVINSKLTSFDKEDLIKHSEDLKEKFLPREGYAPCKYCGKQVPIDELVEHTIISRQYQGLRKTFKYCSDECGNCDQMGHEG